MCAPARHRNTRTVRWMDRQPPPATKHIVRKRSALSAPAKYAFAALHNLVTSAKKQWSRLVQPPKSCTVGTGIRRKNWAKIAPPGHSCGLSKAFWDTSADVLVGKGFVQPPSTKPALPSSVYDRSKKTAVRVNRPLKHRKTRSSIPVHALPTSRNVANILRAMVTGDTQSIEHLTRVPWRPMCTTVEAGDMNRGRSLDKFENSSARKKSPEGEDEAESEDEEDMYALYGVEPWIPFTSDVGAGETSLDAEKKLSMSTLSSASSSDHEEDGHVS